MANPSASFCASYVDWNKKFNRHVNKGETGIKILVPAPKKVEVEREVTSPDGTKTTEKVEKKIMYYKTGTVFDISQTSGEPLPRLTKQLTYSSEELDEVVEKIFKTSKVPVSYDDSLKGEFSANGYYRIDTNEIFLKPELSSLHKLKTLIHEYSHFQQETFFKDAFKTQDRKNTKEVIAESTAYCVLQMLKYEFNFPQLDSSDYSLSYVASWSSDKELKELKSTLELISKISLDIYSWIKDLF